MELFRAEFAVNFTLPKRIARLGELAYNMWWSWHPEAMRLYSRIDKDLWENTNHNPVLFLRKVERANLKAVINNRYYVEFYDRILAEFDAYMKSGDTWFSRQYPDFRNRPIAYFSMEYGLHEIFPIYAGGLGVLSGDHVKEASDMGLPFVAIGLYYSEGYFNKRITEDGWQEAQYAHHALEDLPIMAVVDENGKHVSISIELPGREVTARVWEIHAGRVPVYLLDTNVAENSAPDKVLSARLYSSDLELRIRRADGELRWGTLSWTTIYDREGSSAGVQGTIRDITRRKAVEAATWRRSQELAALNLIAARLNQSLHLSNTLADALHALLEVGEAEFGAIHAIDEQQAVLRPLTACPTSKLGGCPVRIGGLPRRRESTGGSQ